MRYCGVSPKSTVCWSHLVTAILAQKSGVGWCERSALAVIVWIEVSLLVYFGSYQLWNERTAIQTSEMSLARLGCNQVVTLPVLQQSISHYPIKSAMSSLLNACGVVPGSVGHWGSLICNYCDTVNDVIALKLWHGGLWWLGGNNVPVCYVLTRCKGHQGIVSWSHHLHVLCECVMRVPWLISVIWAGGSVELWQHTACTVHHGPSTVIALRNCWRSIFKLCIGVS